MKSKDSTQESLRGGARAGAGRKPVLQAMQKLSVSVDSQTAEALLRLGDGKVSAGVRAAVAIATDPAQASRSMTPATSEFSRTWFHASGRWRLESSQSTDPGEDRPRRDEVALIDPAKVTVHRFHSRHASALGSDALQELKASMLRRGGNVLPVLLFKGNGGQLELIFGRRRLRVAYELGLPVTAVIQEWNSDVEAVRSMAVESRGGDLPWSVLERGTMLKGCLEAGLYPSKRRVAEDLGWSLSEVNQTLAAAELPPELIAAFRAPGDLEAEWVQPLVEALGRNPQAVLATAHGFASGASKASPRTRYLDLKRSALGKL